jgi:hypothetical protein
MVSLVLTHFVAQPLPNISQNKQNPLLSILYNLALQFVSESKKQISCYRSVSGTDAFAFTRHVYKVKAITRALVSQMRRFNEYICKMIKKNKQQFPE